MQFKVLLKKGNSVLQSFGAGLSYMEAHQLRNKLRLAYPMGVLAIEKNK